MKLELGEESYRITDGDNEGELTDYEDAAILESGGELYAAFLDSEETAREGCSRTVYKLTPVTTDTEAVEFDEGGDAEADEPENVSDPETVTAE